MVIGLVAAVGALLLVVNWHARTFAYRCRNCDNEFAISAPLDFISPHAFDFKGGWMLLRCPRCGHWTRAPRHPQIDNVRRQRPAALALTAGFRPC